MGSFLRYIVPLDFHAALQLNHAQFEKNSSEIVKTTPSLEMSTIGDWENYVTVVTNSSRQKIFSYMNIVYVIIAIACRFQ
jgi:hypothetical protein